MTLITSFFQKALCILVLIASCACSKESDEENNDPGGSNYLIFNSSTAQIGGEGGIITRTIESDLQWQVVATNYYSWLQISPTSGYGDCTLEFAVSPNTTNSTRYAYVEISADDPSIQKFTFCIAQTAGSGDTGGGGNTGGDDTGGGGNTGGGDSGDTQKPSVPTGLSAVQSGETIVVSWNAVSNAYYYRLWYSTPSGQEDFTNVYAPSTSAVFDRNMKDGTYRFWIQALNSNYDESAKSSKVSCTFKSNGGGNTGGDDKPSKLDTPKNLEAYSGGSFVQISFDEVSLAYQYELYRSTSATSGYTKISASGGSTSGNRYVLTDSNPKSGTTYYKVKAKALSYLGIADSDFSAYVKVTRQNTIADKF